MRLAVDTSNLVSAAIMPTPQTRVLLRFLDDQRALLYSYESFRELSSVLQRDKFRRYINAEKVQEFLAWVLEVGHLVVPNRQIRACRDEKDNKILELALAEEADFIVSGDRDLLDMVSFENIPIVSVACFVKQVLEAGD